ncbi:methylmalonyl-CoA mutase subunit beta [Winogradskyella alexanderae]|uniref:Methylmalonyl-CoA mutase subunit beta n=1 Tax=Winogradskyella alexanderae TaxID=2877123 RepID=A0ABS7XRA2_9FLAO|nr:methylmalonyl-CoA mutase subunit beta [Winogradskyella alexanderae]MCA0132270.1 methylmalonyl-CoA mutase subunit beta [Winogradskyella alexanderae]
MSKNLFDEFEAVTSKAWKQKIQVDLKGADYNETLIWRTNEGIDVKPFYHSDEFETLPEISQTSATGWKVCQFFEVKDATKGNKLAKDAIYRGAESLIFQIANDTIVIEDLLDGIDLKKIRVFLKCGFLSDSVIKKTFEFASGNITILTDIIANLSKSGNWFKSLTEDHKELEGIIKSTNQLTVDLDLYQNSGAKIIQQLAYALAHANEYLNHFEGILDTSAKKAFEVTFLVSIGNNYFFEIAKLRALRNLWSILAREYGINEECTIIASPSRRNKTIYDYNVNMLRTTTECMSAIIGGANVIYNLPYDNLYHESNEFGNRIARNQLLVLKNESYLDKVNNPADGAYYIETLTDQLSKKALDLFKDIEKNGGFLSQLKEGTIQRKIKESASKEQDDFESGKLVLLGTNKHPNPEDKMKSNIEKNPFLKKESRKTLIEPIIEKRLSEQLEIRRLNEE